MSNSKSNVYSLALLASVLLIGYGIYRLKSDLFGDGWAFLGLGSIGAILFGLLSWKNNKNSGTAKIGLGFGLTMGALASVAGLIIITLIGWVFFTFGFG